MVRTSRKLSILGKVAVQQARRHRMLRAALDACQATIAHLWRVLHQLWLEVTGFVFLVLAGIGGLAFFREYARHEAGETNLARILVAICFTLLFGWFGLSSFWRVRKRS